MHSYQGASLLILFWMALAESFSVAPRSITSTCTFTSRGISGVSISRIPSKRSLYYYGTGDEDDEDIVSGLVGGDTGEQQQTQASINTQGYMNRHKGALARIVSAFPPQGHALELSRIEDVSVVGFDDKHMEVEASLCEGESCSAVAVPVEFPHSCADTASLGECVLDNFEELDQQAELVLQHDEWKALNQGNSQDTDDALLSNTLLETTNESVQFPTWWVSSSSDCATPELAAECDTLRELFNEEEFAYEIRLLAKFGLGLASLALVEDAVVTAVGPAGIIVQAQLLADDSNAGTSTGISTITTDGLVGIPLAFPKIATTAAELRSNALSVIDSSTL
ncbi:expressed unknown protein [Seminavis robusta]|uniref:Uncharacterized protein n=1 Tax=Seminavis robusta TaxID=568900 RepID=A0A9N8HI95_9STRA|nr:expressed unknown protein [Seminavis robusta]|eukprot:Sro581_g170210.1 n/a (338) ;mRNA; r:1822-2835